MKIAVAADHAGFPLKAKVIDVVRAHGHEAIDLGTNSTDPVDYPDIARAIGEAIQRGDVARGVLLCGSGVGAAIAATKLRGHPRRASVTTRTRRIRASSTTT